MHLLAAAAVVVVVAFDDELSDSTSEVLSTYLTYFVKLVVAAAEHYVEEDPLRVYLATMEVEYESLVTSRVDSCPDEKQGMSIDSECLQMDRRDKLSFL